VIVLTRRQSPWGFGAGAFIVSFWDWQVLFRSPIGIEGIKSVETVLRGGSPDPGTLIQFLAGCGRFLIIAACIAGFLQLVPKRRQWGELIGGGVLAISFQLVTSFTVGLPAAAVHIRQALGL
jgi:hypothetical protein